MVRAFPGEIIDSSVVAAPDWTVSHAMDGPTDTVTVRFARPDGGRVLSSALVVFDVTADEAPVAISADALDVNDNDGHLYQVDILAPGDPRICRGER
ncbi:MAG: hypothetical protein ACREEP_07115 [Dongiaceae bacterium]